MSRRPNFSTAPAKRRSMFSTFETSARIATAVPPERSIAAVVSRAAFSLLAKLTITLAPREPYRSAIALPIPRAEPVTSATFPWRFVIARPVLPVTRLGSEHHAAGGFDALAGHPMVVVG